MAVRSPVRNTSAVLLSTYVEAFRRSGLGFLLVDFVKPRSDSIALVGRREREREREREIYDLNRWVLRFLFGRHGKAFAPLRARIKVIGPLGLRLAVPFFPPILRFVFMLLLLLLLAMRIECWGFFLARRSQ